MKEVKTFGDLRGGDCLYIFQPCNNRFELIRANVVGNHIKYVNNNGNMSFIAIEYMVGDRLKRITHSFHSDKFLEILSDYSSTITTIMCTSSKEIAESMLVMSNHISKSMKANIVGKLNETLKEISEHF